MARPRFVRGLYAGLGFLSLGVAVVGIVLPLVPTTPLLLLAAFFFARSSDRLYRWLLGHPRFGPPIRAYREGRGVPLRAKVTAVVAIAVTFGITLGFVVRATLARAALLAIAIAVTVFILTRPTSRGA